MSNTEELEDIEDRPHVGWVPRVLTGGKGPPEEPTEDWLSPLEAGTTFVCRQNKSTVDGELYHILFKGSQFFLLKYCLPDGKMWDRYVNPKSFCKVYKEYEILGVHKQDASETGLKEAPEGDGEEYGKSNRSDRPVNVVLHEAVPGMHQLPQTDGSEETNLSD